MTNINAPLENFKVEGKSNDFSVITCKVKQIHYDAIYLERTIVDADSKPVTAVIFNTGYGMRSGVIFYL